MQALTEAAPTAATDGVSLAGLQAIVPVVTAPGANTITSGSLLAYIFMASLGGWFRLPRGDENLSDLTGLVTAALGAFPVNVNDGRFALITSNVVLSGGSSITIDFVTYSRGERVWLDSLS